MCIGQEYSSINLIIGDESSGIEEVIKVNFLHAKYQRCVIHVIKI